ncbi:TonB-dependent receptor [Longibacter salinarum]|uniref:TonB-dependent receptor n=2 Tax=Longibacter salinarum TaxID=1850348 RepID=A0A2A8CX49_9BACT|nr:TonB-dependent receptor [Longibacter salinarum]
MSVRLLRAIAWSAAVGLFISLFAPTAIAQTDGFVAGTVRDASNTPIPGVTVLVRGTNYGTATNEDGYYRMTLPAGRYALRFSAVGFAARTDSVVVRRGETTELNVELEDAVMEMEGVTVEEEGATKDAGVFSVDPEDVQSMPTPFKDGFRALKVVPGVATNNELSQQYSVRGGGYNENLIFLNGFEVYMPFRPRQGEQEGLGLLNPDLAQSITFYTGGFPARYGGKLSSALDVQYQEPENAPIHGSASMSTLDASIHAGSSALDNSLSWTIGARHAQPGRFFGTQDLKGEYDPRFSDVQGAATYRLGGGHEIEALGIYADHQFELNPTERRTFFGIISLNPRIANNQFRSLWSDLAGARTDGYTTRFGGVRLRSPISDKIELSHAVAYYSTTESENFDITGDADVYEVDPTAGANNPENYNRLSNSQHTNFADNSVDVETLTGRGRYRYNLARHALEAGWHVRSLHFDDRLNEKTVIETGRGDDYRRIVVDSLSDAATFNEMQSGFYVQDAVDVLPQRGRFVVTGGVRTDYYTFNDEWTVSPRISATFQANEQLTLTGSWGLYHQKPIYRELRGSAEASPDVPDGGVIDDLLNRDLKSQQSSQFVLGGEYFFPSLRLYLRTEAYYKDLSNIVSYTIDDIRVEYSGENDADGYIAGFDTQIRGELVPGLESWFNYSFMIARERFKPQFQDEFNQGLVPRPTDQRHTFSAFVQDYVPGDKTWKLHMRALYGSGLPYTPPVPGPDVNGQPTRQPGDRMSARITAYRRVDIGATKEITVVEDGIGRTPVKLDLTLEVLNMFDMDNTVTYSWEGDWTRVPKRLTPRTLNARVRLTF